jgi:hypothetical protein
MVGHSVVAIRMEFEKDDGAVETVDVAPPEEQVITRRGKSFKKAVPRMEGNHDFDPVGTSCGLAGALGMVGSHPFAVANEISRA